MCFKKKLVFVLVFIRNTTIRLREKESAVIKYHVMKLEFLGKMRVQNRWICFSLNQAVLAYLVSFVLNTKF